MESNEISSSTKVLRPASILLKDKDVIYVYPGTKRILNWTFASITDGRNNLNQCLEQHRKSDSQTYLNFNDFNYENFQNEHKANFNNELDYSDMPRFLSENPSSSQETSTQETQPLRKETMGRRTPESEPNNNQQYTSSSRNNQQIGNQRTERANIIYGWRKQCLYFILFLLMVLISINLALTLWILKVMEVSSDGMGQLKVTDKGIQLDGQAVILNELRTSHIHSRHGQPITFESSKNITFNTRDADGMLENQLFLGHDKFEVQTKNFRVSDTHGNTLFYVDRDLVEIAAGSLRVEGEGGVIFKESIQTPLLKAEPGKDLKLESPTRSLELDASEGIFMHSRAGSIEATSLNDIKLHSLSGSIRFDAENIILSSLKATQPTSEKPGHLSMHKIYQICVCENGKLFLASPYSVCAGDETNFC